MSDPKAHLANLAASITRDMDQLLAELKAPDRLVAAMRHAVLAGGKRLRPVLVLETTHLLAAGTHAKTQLPPARHRSRWPLNASTPIRSSMTTAPHG